MPDEKGETRRERNERFGEESPELYVPVECEYLWHWYHEISAGAARIREGFCHRITWTELLAWKTLTKNVVTSFDVEVLTAMDDAFCMERNKEFAAMRERTSAQQRADVEKARGRKGRK